MFQENVKKWVGYFVFGISLWLGGKYLVAEAYKIFAEYGFYAYLAFCGADVLVHLKDTITAFRKK